MAPCQLQLQVQCPLPRAGLLFLLLVWQTQNKEKQSANPSPLCLELKRKKKKEPKLSTCVLSGSIRRETKTYTYSGALKILSAKKEKKNQLIQIHPNEQV